jgi:hypothetical protein
MATFLAIAETWITGVVLDVSGGYHAVSANTT